MAKLYIFVIIMGLIILPNTSLADNNHGDNPYLGDSMVDGEMLPKYYPTTFEGKARKPIRNRLHPPPRHAPSGSSPPHQGIPVTSFGGGGGGGGSGGSGGGGTNKN
ncbi:hypothetical protein ABFX02_07G046100 [Erythranthe guttata]